MPLTTWGHACFDLRVYKITTASRKSEGHKVFALLWLLYHIVRVVQTVVSYLFFFLAKVPHSRGQVWEFGTNRTGYRILYCEDTTSTFHSRDKVFCGLTSKVSNSWIRYEGQKISVHFTALFSIVCLFIPRVIAYFALHHPVRYSYAAYPTPVVYFYAAKFPFFTRVSSDTFSTSIKSTNYWLVAL